MDQFLVPSLQDARDFRCDEAHVYLDGKIEKCPAGLYLDELQLSNESRNIWFSKGRKVVSLATKTPIPDLVFAVVINQQLSKPALVFLAVLPAGWFRVEWNC